MAILTEIKMQKDLEMSGFKAMPKLLKDTTLSDGS